jgi:hypothetical protein
MNNCGPVASDFYAAEYTNTSWRHLTSWHYPDANYSTRREIWRAHRDYQQGLLWFLSHDEGLPPIVRDTMAKWGLCADEFSDTNGWPPSLYIREARRMVGDRVLVQADVREGATSDIGLSSLGLAAHAEDSHNMQRFACTSPSSPPCNDEGPRRLPKNSTSTPFAWNEGDYHNVDQAHIYQLPHFLALPSKSESANLLVVAAPSASHVAMSTFRMEPAYMVFGTSVGVWAAVAALNYSGDVNAVPLQELNMKLLAAGQVLKQPPTPPTPPHPPHPAVAGYDCRKWDRCVGVVSPPATANDTCSGRCKGLGPDEWLANTEVFKLGTAHVDGKEVVVSVTAKTDAAYLKKSEAHSSTLPDADKMKVSSGTTVKTVPTPVAQAEDTYWFVTLA